MLDRLREVLASMSKKEFLTQWQEITERNKDVAGPTVREFMANFSCPVLDQPQHFQLTIDIEFFSNAGEYHFAMAA